MIKAILACDDKGGVSRNGTLPWPKNKTDLTWFKENTLGDVVVMGSTTWEDPHMPRPLPNRKNVLVTSRTDDFPDAPEVIQGDLQVKLKGLEETHPDQTIWVIGGPNIVNQCLNTIDEFYLSRIPGDYDCDTFLTLTDIAVHFTKAWSEKHVEVEFEIWKKLNGN